MATTSQYRPYGHRPASTQPSPPAVPPHGPSGASRPWNATARDWSISPPGQAWTSPTSASRNYSANPGVSRAGHGLDYRPGRQQRHSDPDGPRSGCRNSSTPASTFHGLRGPRDPQGRVAMPGEMTNTGNPRPVTLDQTTAAQATGRFRRPPVPAHWQNGRRQLPAPARPAPRRRAHRRRTVRACRRRPRGRPGPYRLRRHPGRRPGTRTARRLAGSPNGRGPAHPTAPTQTDDGPLTIKKRQPQRPGIHHPQGP